MKDALLIELNTAHATPRDAARHIKEALQTEGDNTSDVYERTSDSVLVVVYESHDAEDEIADRLSDAGVDCFVEEAGLPGDDEVATELPDW